MTEDAKQEDQEVTETPAAETPATEETAEKTPEEPKGSEPEKPASEEPAEPETPAVAEPAPEPTEEAPVAEPITEPAVPAVPTIETGKEAAAPASATSDTAPPIPNLSETAEKADPFTQEEGTTASAPVLNTRVEVARQALPTIKGARENVEEEDDEPEVVEEEPKEERVQDTHIYALRTTANREDQVMGFVASNAGRKKLGVYSVIAPHGMRGYIFVEAGDRHEAEQAAFGVPYAKGLLPNEIEYKEIEHMLEQVKKDINIQKNDIAEILSGPFKREKAKIARVDKAKEEVVVELLEAAVPIPITLKIDSVKVIRRDEK